MLSNEYKKPMPMGPNSFSARDVFNKVVGYFLNRREDHNKRDHHWNDYTRNMLLLSVSKPCWGFFVDRYGSWYCSLRDRHQVIRNSLVPHNLPDVPLLGDDHAGTSSKSLSYPTAIYVDNDNLDVYIADTGNDRIQLLNKGATEGRTIVGESGETCFRLDRPIGLTMDKNGSLYILQRFHHRILRCSHDYCHCIIKCSISNSSSPNQLHWPAYLAFNSRGSLIFLNRKDRQIRIRQFDVAKQSCCKYPREFHGREEEENVYLRLFNLQ